MSDLPKKKKAGLKDQSAEIKERNGDSCDSKLNLILGVPLKGRVVLGETRKKLADLLALTPGMVVETEKNVDENVDLYINNKIVARGEVVVVGESFGFRIKKILTPVDRDGVDNNGHSGKAG